MSKFTCETGIDCTLCLEELTYPSRDFLAATLSSGSVQNFRENSPLCDLESVQDIDASFPDQNTEVYSQMLLVY